MLISKLSIKNKIILSQLATSVIVLLLCSVFLIVNEYSNLKNSLTSNVKSLSNIICVNTKSALLFNDSLDASSILNSFSELSIVEHVALFDSNDQLFSTYKSKSNTYNTPKIIDTDTEIYTTEIENAIFLQRSILDNDNQIGTLCMYVSLKGIRKSIFEYIKFVIIVLVIGTFLAFIIASLLQKSITTPIDTLIASVRKITKYGTYNSEVKVISNDELGLLSLEFNKMIRAIKLKNKEIEEYNAFLADKVKERTLDLELAYSELKEKAEELDESNNNIKEFTYVVSHHLKSPIRAIGSLVEWVEDDLSMASNVSEETFKHITLIKKRAERLQNLVISLLDYVNIGKSQKLFFDTDLNSIVNYIKKTLIFPEGFTFLYPKNLPTIKTNQNDLAKVLKILIENSLMHHDKDKGLIELKFEEKEFTYEFTVLDDGPGIDPAFHKKIFDMFQTLEIRDIKESSGAGLALAKKIIEGYNGTIHVSLNQPTGSIFKFTFPKID